MCSGMPCSNVKEKKNKLVCLKRIMDTAVDLHDNWFRLQIIDRV